MEFEDILIKVGEDGLFQKLYTFLFLAPVAIITPWLTMTTIFLVSTPKHICLNSHLIANLTDNQRHSFISNSSITDKQKCFSDNHLNTSKCADWLFDQSNYQETFVTKNKLVCDDEHYVGTALAAISLGQLVGTPILGYISDKYGRKRAYFLAILIGFISTLSPTLSTGIFEFIILRFIHGLATNCCYQMPLIMAVEIFNPKKRTRITLICNTFFALGLTTLPLAAYLTGHWFWMSTIASIIAFASLIIFRWVPESPRWLISVKRYDEAYQILHKIATVNEIKIDPSDLMLDIREAGKKFEKTNPSERKKNLSRIKNFLHKEIIIILLLNSFSLVASEVAYTGLHYNIRNFEGNEFLNFFLLASVEPFSYVIGYYLMDSRLGRRWTSVIALAFTGSNLLICSAIDPFNLIMVAIFSMFGKMGATLGYAVIGLHASEMLPTVIRNQGLSVVFFVLSLGSIAIPYIILLGKYGNHIPLIIIGTVDLTASFFASFLPETRNKNLPQTIAESEQLIRKRRYFSLAPRRETVISEDECKAINLEQP